MWLFRGAAIVLGPLPPGRAHAHLAAQLVVALGAPFALEVDGRERRLDGALLGSRMTHRLSPTADGVAVLLVDPSDEALAGGPSGLRAFEASEVAEVSALARSVEQAPRCAERAEELRRALTELLGPSRRPMRRDERVARTLARLDSMEHANRSLEELAHDVGLSPGRLRHLFRDEVGLPIRSYRLWARLLMAVRSIAEGSDLTRAAHDAGFADSAHLSRAFRDLFGLAPSTLRGAEVRVLES